MKYNLGIQILLLCLRKSENTAAKKQKHYGRRKRKMQSTFWRWRSVFIIEKLARDVTERCKLPEGIEFRKKLGYNHNDIMVREETSIAEKIKKLFPHKDIVLNKKFKI